MVLFLKLWIKKNSQTQQKKSLASPFWILHFGLILLLWALTYCWYCSCNNLPLRCWHRLCFLFLIPSNSKETHCLWPWVPVTDWTPPGWFLASTVFARLCAPLASLLQHCYQTYSVSVSLPMVLLRSRLYEKNCQWSSKLCLLLLTLESS